MIFIKSYTIEDASTKPNQIRDSLPTPPKKQYVWKTTNAFNASHLSWSALEIQLKLKRQGG